MVRLLTERKIHRNDYVGEYVDDVDICDYYFAKTSEINKLKKDGMLANNLRANIVNNNLIISYNFCGETCELEWKNFLDKVVNNFVEEYLHQLGVFTHGLPTSLPELLLIMNNSTDVDFDLDLLFNAVENSFQFGSYHWDIIDSKKSKNGNVYELDDFKRLIDNAPFESVFISREDIDSIKELVWNAFLKVYDKDFISSVSDIIRNEYFEDTKGYFSEIEDFYSDDEHKKHSLDHYLGYDIEDPNEPYDYEWQQYQLNQEKLKPYYKIITNGEKVFTLFAPDNFNDAIEYAKENNCEMVIEVVPMKSSADDDTLYFKGDTWKNPNYVPEPKKKTRKRK